MSLEEYTQADYLAEWGVLPSGEMELGFFPLTEKTYKSWAELDEHTFVDTTIEMDMPTVVVSVLGRYCRSGVSNNG
jgi:hypothetical protein